jgi:hypothetical protein
MGLASAKPGMLGQGALCKNLFAQRCTGRKNFQKPHFTKCTESPSSIYQVYDGIICLKSLVRLKVWWHDDTLFVYFLYFMIYIHSFNHIHTIHLSVAIRRGISPYLHRWLAQWETSLWCRAEDRTRACLTASRCSANLATPHHEQRRTIRATPHYRLRKLVT